MVFKNSMVLMPYRMGLKVVVGILLNFASTEHSDVAQYNDEQEMQSPFSRFQSGSCGLQ